MSRAHATPWTATLAATFAATVLAVGCAATHDSGHAGDVARPDAPALDTITGQVQVVGSDPGTFVVIRTAEGQMPVAGPSMAMAALRNVAGVVVEAVGARGEAAFEVDWFRVIEAQGRPAADGVLEIDGDAAVLVTRTGRRVRFSSVPSALRGRTGQWVWIAAPPGSEPQLWGVIDESAPWD